MQTQDLPASRLVATLHRVLRRFGSGPEDSAAGQPVPAPRHRRQVLWDLRFDRPDPPESSEAEAMLDI